MCFRNISGDFSANSMKKSGLNGLVYEFSVDYRTFDASNIIDIHKYLMKKISNKTIFGLIKKMLIGSLTDLVNESNHTKCMSLSNKKCEIQPTLIN